MRNMEGAPGPGRSLQMRGPGNTRRTWMRKKVADVKEDTESIAEMKKDIDEMKKDTAEVKKETEELKV